ncbi:MAG: ornithine carbamoyltransferase [Acidimicrobiia bacterium]|nr:ornithine carbamoyltransferase [Acidimicrobiia bacterium]
MSANLLTIDQLRRTEVEEMLRLAEQPIDSLGRPLEGAGAALIFEKPSNRTRHSMEMAVVQLGGHPVYTPSADVGFDIREPVEDIGRIMEGYHSMIAARVFAHSTVTRLAGSVDIPVVNMLSDHAHPLQALADALTMRQCLGGALGDLGGMTVAYVGDYNNVARSLAEISLLLGMNVRLACPLGFGPGEAELERLTLLGNGAIESTARPADAVAGANAVHTDTWVSMGQEDDKAERRRLFEGFTVDDDMMSLADPSAVFMHCLPAYRGFEVTAEVIDGPRSVVFQQGHNRLHAARGALAHLCGVRPPGSENSP